MKKDLHPSDYRPVVFQDTSSGFGFLTKSTAATQEKIKWEDGNEYPLVKVHISSASHPFFTGEEKIVDVEGRVDKFKARALAAEKVRQAKVDANAKATAKKEKKAVKSDQLPVDGEQSEAETKPKASTKKAEETEVQEEE